MKREKQRRKAIIKVLTDPDPTFVSMVRRGANQRPFHAIKHAEGETTPETKETMDMSKRQKETKGAPDVVIARVLFAKSDWADAEAVTNYMTEKGYSDFEVKEEDDRFVVEDSADEIDGDTRECPSTTVKGVTYVVGSAKKSAEAEGGEGTEGGEGAGEAEGGDTSGKSEGEDKPEDTPETADAPDEKTDTQKAADAKDKTAKAEDKKTPAVRARTRKASILVGGLSETALAHEYEKLGDFFAEKGITAKGFGETVADFSDGQAPGLWVLSDALMRELRKAVKSGRADEAYITDLASKFARGVTLMTSAYEQIINDAVAAAKAAHTEVEVDDAVLDHLFGADPGAPGAQKALDIPAEFKAEFVAMKEAITQFPILVQRAVNDTLAVMAFEAEPERKTESRVLPARKSESNVQDNPSGVDAAPDQDEMEEQQRRVSKRLGLNL